MTYQTMKPTTSLFEMSIYYVIFWSRFMTTHKFKGSEMMLGM